MAAKMTCPGGTSAAGGGGWSEVEGFPPHLRLGEGGQGVSWFLPLALPVHAECRDTPAQGSPQRQKVNIH